MAAYKVLAPGFYDSILYDPNGKRPVLYTDKPIPKKEMPSWLERISVKEAEDLTPSEEVKDFSDDEIKKEIDSVNFVDDPTLSGPTETI